MDFPETLVTNHMRDALIVSNHLALSRKSSKDSYLVNSAVARAKDRWMLCAYLPYISFCVEWSKLVANKTNDYNLIDYRMDDAELTAFDAWLAKQAGDPTAVLTELAAADYKISLTYVESSSAWCVSITGKENQKFNAKATLTTWADEPLEGIYMAYFKVFSVFKSGKWATKTQSRRG